MKKRFMLAAVISCVVISVLSAQQSIEGVLRKFDGAISQAAIPKAQVSIGFISYAETDTSGTVVPWMQSEIKKAAAKMRHIDVIQSKMLPPQEQTGIATRGASFGKQRTGGQKDQKYILTGKYYENKTAGIVELTLELSSTSGKLLASETALIPMTEISNRNLMLYPENLAQAEAIKEEFTQAAAEVHSAPLVATDKTQQKTGSTSAAADKTLKQQTTFSSAAAKAGTIDITAVMLDSENNLVDILYPGDTVKFLVSIGKNAYIAIMGIDAQGNQYWLPVKDNFLKADMPRTFPDGDVDYQVVDGVFGSEHLFIYAASTPEELPTPTGDGAYQPNTILSATRGMTAVSKRKKSETGVFAIPYTVMKK
ncbi:MAG: DUF4384 domain-containing protein [Treponema sp.]|uniref:DUF4384 domain-containing protein n=1 Tax=Treponema sp. TaxID=166 RepID=UPI003FA1EA3E